MNFIVFELASGGQILINRDYIVSAVELSGDKVSLVVGHEETEIYVRGTLGSIMVELVKAELESCA